MVYTWHKQTQHLVSDPTPNDVVTAGVLVAHAYVLLLLLVPAENPLLAILQTATGILFLTFVPGVLFLGLLGTNLNDLTTLVFSIGVSLCLLMGFGFILNTLFTNVPILPDRPFSAMILYGSVFAMTLGLTAAFRMSGRQPNLPPFRRILRQQLATRIAIVAVMLPVLATLGALVLNRTGDSHVVVLALVMVALVPIVVFVFDVPSRYYPMLLWMAALALLLQNSLVLNELQVGDAEREYYNANLVLTHGAWDSDFSTTKNGMLRIVVLHPLYTEFTSLSLFWQFKVVHPLLFSVIALAMYLICTRLLKRRLAFLTVFTFISFHTFFTVYAQNTRSGIALLFMTMMVLLLVRTDRRDELTVPLLLLFSFGVVVSHYGTAIIFAGILSVACVIRLGLRLWRGEPPLQFSMVSVVAFYWIALLAWSFSTTSGRIFQIFVGAVVAIGAVLREMLVTESVGRRAVESSPSSLTHQYIQYEFIGIAVLVGLGLLLSGIAIIRLDRCLPIGPVRLPIELNQWHFALSVGATTLIVLAFSPIRFFGVSRFWTIAMLFLLPYAFVSIAVFARQFDTSRVYSIVSVVLAITLLVNAGVATVFLNERSTQPHLNEDGIIENGDDVAVFEVYHQQMVAPDMAASEWILEHRAQDRSIYGPGPNTAFPGHLLVTERALANPPGDYHPYSGGSIPSDSYLFINAYTTETGLFYLPFRGGVGVTVEENAIPVKEIPVNEQSSIYDAGDAKLYGS